MGLLGFFLWAGLVISMYLRASYTFFNKIFLTYKKKSLGPYDRLNLVLSTQLHSHFEDVNTRVTLNLMNCSLVSEK